MRHGAGVVFPTDLGTRPAALGLRQIALSHLERARQAARKVLKGKDADKNLHTYRVSLRRLRVMADHDAPSPLMSKKRFAQLKGLHTATGLGRDYDVQASWVRILAEENSLKAEPALGVLKGLKPKKKKPGGVKKALRAFEDWEEGARAKLSTLPTPPMDDCPTLAATTAATLRRCLPSARKALSRLADGPDEKTLHKARLKIKALRYVVEPLAYGPYELAPLIDGCTALQDWLGDAHDLRLLAERLDAFESDDEEEDETLATLTRAAEVKANLQLAKALELGLRQRGEGEGKPFSAFLDAFERAAHRMAGQSDHLEIERKYLLTALPPEVTKHACLELDQGYLPGHDVRERVRRIRGPQGVAYRRTIKAGRGVSRIEFEEPMDESVFEQLWPLTEGARVSKRRYVVPDGDLVWEIDEFRDRELVLAEIELASADFVPTMPGWLAPYVVRDVSDESGFVNQKLAR